MRLGCDFVPVSEQDRAEVRTPRPCPHRELMIQREQVLHSYANALLLRSQPTQAAPTPPSTNAPGAGIGLI